MPAWSILLSNNLTDTFHHWSQTCRQEETFYRHTPPIPDTNLAPKVKTRALKTTTTTHSNRVSQVLWLQSSLITQLNHWTTLVAQCTDTGTFNMDLCTMVVNKPKTAVQATAQLYSPPLAHNRQKPLHLNKWKKLKIACNDTLGLNLWQSTPETKHFRPQFCRHTE